MQVILKKIETIQKPTLHPGIAVRSPNDLIGQVLHVLLDFRIIESSADQTLGSVERVTAVGYRLTFGWHTDKAFTLLGEGYVRWGRSGTFAVLHNLIKKKYDLDLSG